MARGAKRLFPHTDRSVLEVGAPPRKPMHAI